MTVTAFNRRRRELAAAEAEAAAAQAEPEPADDAQDEMPLQRLTKAELLEIAGHSEITVPASATKAQIIELLLAEPVAVGESE